MMELNDDETCFYSYIHGYVCTHAAWNRDSTDTTELKNSLSISNALRGSRGPLLIRIQRESSKRKKRLNKDRTV